MARCFPFPPPGYENEMKSSNGELGNLEKKKKHNDKKVKKEKRKQERQESKDEDKVKHLETDKKDKKHKHHKHKKDKAKDRDGDQNRENIAMISDRHGGHEFGDKKRFGDAQDSPKKGETISIKFVEREGTRENNGKARDIGMGGDQKIDMDRGKRNGNVRKRKEIDTESFIHFGDVEDSPKKREAVMIKFVERDRQGNRKCEKIDLSDREGSRQNNGKTRDDGMEEDQKTGKYRGKSNGKVRKSKEIETNSYLHVGDAWESPKIREAVSIKFVERERLGNGKCHKLNLSDTERSRQNKDNTRDNGMEGDQKFDKDRNKSNDIARKRKEINTNSSSHDKDKWSNKHFQTAFSVEVFSDIGRSVQEAKDGVIECRPTSSVQKASSAAPGKCVDGTNFLPSFSGKDKRFKMSLPTAFSKEVDSGDGSTVQEVKDGPVECISETRVQEANNAALEKFVASKSCHPSFSGKDKQSNKCSQAAFSKEVHSDIGKKVQKAKDCAVECIPESKVQEISKTSLGKHAASSSCHPSFSGKDKWSNKRPQTVFVGEVHSDFLRKVQEAKDGAVECLLESRVQEASNSALRKCVASTSYRPSLSGTDKQSNNCSQTAFAKEVLSDTGRIVQEAKEGAVECQPGSRVQEASNATLQNCLASTSCLPSFFGDDWEQNGAADCKTNLHSHINTKAVDVVASRNRTDKHILDLKYLCSVPSKQGCSDVDDQAWLFLGDGRKPQAAVKFDHASNVWDRALFLQPNLYGLPYVTLF